jgi:hypothetical protein
LGLRRPADPPLSPPPLSAPRRGQRGEPGFGGWLSGRASTERTVATMDGEPRLLSCGRSQWLVAGVQTTAVATRPAVSETGFATGWRSRQPWLGDRCEFSTTVGLPIGERRSGGDVPCHRSVAGATQPNRGSPLYPGGGREGRGGVWGEEKVHDHKPVTLVAAHARQNVEHQPASARAKKGSAPLPPGKTKDTASPHAHLPRTGRSPHSRQ